MTKARDLVGEMLPTLCEKFLGHSSDPDFETNDPLNHAQDARNLFDALAALQREQRIRDLERVLGRCHELRDAMRRAVEQRSWKTAQNLAASLVVELTELPILALVVLVQEEHKELVAGIDQGAAGFETFDRFALTAFTIVAAAWAEELKAARLEGRGPDRLGAAIDGAEDPRVVQLRDPKAG